MVLTIEVDAFRSREMHRYSAWNCMLQTGGSGPHYDTGEESHNQIRSTLVLLGSLGFERFDTEWFEKRLAIPSLGMLERS